MPAKMCLGMMPTRSVRGNAGPGTVGCRTRAPTAVPPRAGFGTVATGWHATSARATANAAARSLLRKMRYHPDVGHRADQERHDQDPCRPVDLALETATRAVATAQPITAAADGAAKTRRLGRLDQDARGEKHGEHSLRNDQGVLELGHGTRRFYLARLGPRSRPSRSVR